MTKYKGIILALCLLGIYTWFVWPKGEDSNISLTNSSSSNEKETVPYVPNTRGVDTSPKFISDKDIKIKPLAGEDESKTLIKEIPAPPLSKELQDELGDSRVNGYGSIPKIETDSNVNPQKLSVIEAIQTGKYPERLSIVGKRVPFNYQSYVKNPDEYLNVSVPSRAFESAMPGEGVKRLTRITSQYVEAYQSETVELSITGAEPNIPVSATVFDGGHFQNDLSAITVKSDQSGSATFKFTPTKGVIQNTRITVASPLSSGVVHFNVYVRKKREQVQK